MAIKTIIEPTTGNTFRFGRRRPVAPGPRLKLGNYLMKSLPAPPQSAHYAPAASQALSQMLGNDTVGNCVEAGMLHLVGVFTGNAGDEAVFTEQQGIGLYSEITGYVSGEPQTDQGTDEVTALNFWEHTGAYGHKIVGSLAINGADPVEVRTALWLFENNFFGIELPDKWINPFPLASGFVWDVAGPADPSNGHCVVGVGYNPQGVRVATWGMIGLITDAAMAEYAVPSNGGALYTVLSTDSLNKAKQKAPNGFDWSQLMADFDSLGGNL